MVGDGIFGEFTSMTGDKIITCSIGLVSSFTGTENSVATDPFRLGGGIYAFSRSESRTEIRWPGKTVGRVKSEYAAEVPNIRGNRRPSNGLQPGRLPQIMVRLVSMAPRIHRTAPFQ